MRRAGSFVLASIFVAFAALVWVVSSARASVYPVATSYVGTLALRPDAGSAGRFAFLTNDAGAIVGPPSVDTGSAWYAFVNESLHAEAPYPWTMVNNDAGTQTRVGASVVFSRTDQNAATGTKPWFLTPITAACPYTVTACWVANDAFAAYANSNDLQAFGWCSSVDSKYLALFYWSNNGTSIGQNGQFGPMNSITTNSFTPNDTNTPHLRLPVCVQLSRGKSGASCSGYTWNVSYGGASWVTVLTVAGTGASPMTNEPDRACFGVGGSTGASSTIELYSYEHSP